MRLLNRERTIAGPQFNRWLIPPAAIAVHMCIGEVYGFSVFNVPLTQVNASWTIPLVGWIYSTALFVLGLSAALFGKWVERSGPRKVIVASCACFCGGLLLSALGIKLQNIWIVYLGYGVIGGIGLGLGYIAPVSTLMKWFPDRPGMATGMAIMGFGGGALIGAPLGVRLMDLFRSAESVGVAESFTVMAVLYGAFMLFGAAVIRIPVDGWRPPGWVGAGSRTEATTQEIGVDEAWRTPQFRLLWVVLCMNVSAGIGILGQSSKMCSDMFGLSPVVGGGFAGLLSIFNMGGRFFWSSVSDRIGRKAVYQIYFMFGTILYCLVPWTQRQQNRPLFVIVTALIISMYGGGFATIPAYLRDIFGTYQVGAIHGRLITAWSVAALIGPTLVNYISTTSVRRGQSAAESYNLTMYLMAVLLLVGFVANQLVRTKLDRKGPGGEL